MCAAVGVVRSDDVREALVILAPQPPISNVLLLPGNAVHNSCEHGVVAKVGNLFVLRELQFRWRPSQAVAADGYAS